MNGINKQEFLNSICKVALFDESFFKKIYGYSVLDKTFANTVAAILSKNGKEHIIEEYNCWLKNYKDEERQILKEVATWYVKECDKNYKEVKRPESQIEKNKDERRDGDWKMKKKELLLRKKKLIMIQSLQKSTANCLN